MKVPAGFTYQEIKPYEFNKELNLIKGALNGRIQFGDLAGRDRNMDGVLVEHQFTGLTEELIVHNLGTTPIGYLVLRNSNGGVVYDGVTRWNAADIYLRSTDAATNALIFILR